jgi:hypothetical protein
MRLLSISRTPGIEFVVPPLDVHFALGVKNPQVFRIDMYI